MADVLLVVALTTSVVSPFVVYIVFKKYELPRFFERKSIAIDDVRRYVGKIESGLEEISKVSENEKIRIELMEKKIEDIEHRIEELQKRILEFEETSSDDISLKVITLRKRGYSLKRISEELKIPISRVRKILKTMTEE
jgi:predicted  nucleic acid-binding Zn-ribbon protein